MKTVDYEIANRFAGSECYSVQSGLTPASDITYALNPLLNYTNVSRALSINGKRQDIRVDDLLTIAEEHAIKNPKRIVAEIVSLTAKWKAIALELRIPVKIIASIEKDFNLLIY